MSNKKIDSIASELTDDFIKDLHAQISKQVQADIAHKLAQIDINATVKQYVDSRLTNSIKTMTFPEGSIPGSAIDISSLQIHGDNVFGGTHKLFMSTGIQDTATECQVTILDSATVVENKLVTSELEVRGDVTIDGNLILNGDIPEDSPFYRDLVEHSAGLVSMSLDGNFFAKYADQVFEKIKTDGLDLSKITLNGAELVQGNKLGYSITDTNIQKLGELRSLLVNGESSHFDTLFVKNKRVGINTEDPAGALAIWDEECEIVARKLRKDVAIVGTLRPQHLVLSSNNKSNITLNPDGSAQIDKLNIGPSIQLSSAAEQPKHNANKGVVLFNENVDVGQPLGWVSLGGARWAPFGIIA